MTRPVAGGPAGVYVHVPFCGRRCHFCSFKITTHLDFLEGWREGVIDELSRRADRWAMPVDTVYFGGGTPSLVPPAALLSILDAIRERLDVAADPEVTVEINPGDYDRSSLGALRAGGVNRLSVGVQSFDDDDLAFLTRTHSGDDGARAIEDAREAGFRSVTVDLMYGLPERPRNRWAAQIDRVAALGADHVSAYLLSIDPGTVFSAMRKRGQLPPLDEEAERELFLFTGERLAAHGFERYEVSSFARGPEHESRHNRKYWEGAPYLGLGPAAHSHRDRERRWNVAAVREYVRRIEAGESPVEERETLDHEARRLERLFLGLRTTRGVPADLVAGRPDLVGRLVEEGLATLAEDRFFLTPEGLAVADGIAASFAR